MSEWTKVVTNPLGLAGFALFLVFGYLSRVKRSDERRWLAPVAVCVAVAALLGGLALAYLQVPRPVAPSGQGAKPVVPTQQQQTNNNVQQTSTGQGSPNVQGVQGEVTITVDQSNGKTKVQQSPAKQPKQENK